MGKKLFTGAHDLFFKSIHHNRLIYNSCWEDPRLDREMLGFDSTSKIVMITSAGCNALDYLLDGPARIHAIDMNFRQNALLQLKLKMIEHSSFDDLFAMFGTGSHDKLDGLYKSVRPQLPGYAQVFWDKNIDYFSSRGLRKSFYYRGTAGNVAWLFRHSFLRANKKVGQYIRDLLEATTLERQRDIYEAVEPELWNAFSRWFVKQPLVMTMLGVPRAQMDLISKEYPGGIPGFIRDMFKHVVTELPFHENYFWRVYLTGSYTRSCCPQYLKKENHATLRERSTTIHTHTNTVTDFLKENPDTYSHYILLDHQDWLAHHLPDALEEEWEYIFKNSKRGTKILMRSASTQIAFLPEKILQRLKVREDMAEKHHKLDRVGTYGSMLFAEVL